MKYDAGEKTRQKETTERNPMKKIERERERPLNAKRDQKGNEKLEIDRCKII